MSAVRRRRKTKRVEPEAADTAESESPDPEASKDEAGQAGKPVEGEAAGEAAEEVTVDMAHAIPVVRKSASTMWCPICDHCSPIGAKQCGGCKAIIVGESVVPYAAALASSED